MARSIRSVGRIAAAVAVPTLMVLGTGVANAATYDLYGKVPKSGAGAASATGTVTFTSAYKFSWTGTIRDICPADGKGAELQIVVRHTDGTQSVKTNVLQDLDGCGSTGFSGSGSFTETKKIKNLMVALYSTEGGQPWVTLDLSPDRDNQYT
jgi:hypothetical protein